MNRSHSLATFVVAASLSLLAGQALAQSSSSSGSNSSSTTTSTTTQSSPDSTSTTQSTQTSTDANAPVSSEVGGIVSETRPITNSPAPGSTVRMNSSLNATTPTGPLTSGAGVDASRGGTTFSGMTAENQVGAQANLAFDKVDADHDGRVSLSEYSQSFPAVPGGSTTTIGSTTPGGSTTTTVTNSSQNGNTRTTSSSEVSTGDRNGAATGVAAGSPPAANPAELFRQLDTNGDGFLTPTELAFSSTSTGSVSTIPPTP